MRCLSCDITSKGNQVVNIKSRNSLENLVREKSLLERQWKCQVTKYLGWILISPACKIVCLYLCLCLLFVYVCVLVFEFLRVYVRLHACLCTYSRGDEGGAALPADWWNTKSPEQKYQHLKLNLMRTELTLNITKLRNYCLHDQKAIRMAIRRRIFSNIKWAR